MKKSILILLFGLFSISLFSFSNKINHTNQAKFGYGLGLYLSDGNELAGNVGGAFVGGAMGYEFGVLGATFGGIGGPLGAGFGGALGFL